MFISKLYIFKIDCLVVKCNTANSRMQYNKQKSSMMARPDLRLAPSPNINYQTRTMTDASGIVINIPKPLPDNSEDLDISLLIDRSGSMEYLHDQTVESLRAFIKEQSDFETSGKGSVKISMWTFDNVIETPWIDVPISEANINWDDLYPRNTTALLDGIGDLLTQKITQYKDIKSPPKQCIVIMTDGQENASVRYNINNIFKLVSECKQKGWKFIFMGANQDAIKTGQNLGFNFNESLTFGANVKDTRESWRVASDSLSRTRSGTCGAFTEVERSKSLSTAEELQKTENLDFNGLARC